MKKIIRTILLIGFCASSIHAQAKYDYNWVFMKTLFSFHEDTVKVSYYDNPTNMGYSNATINDADGEGVGYTNGCKIYASDFSIVQGTDSLNYSDSFFYDDFCTSQFHLGYQSGRQGMMVVPDEERLFLLHEIVDFVLEGDFFGFSENLFYTELGVNNDSLLLVSLQNPILFQEDSIGTGAISGVKHSDNSSWWVIKHDLHSNCYYKMLLKNGQFEEIGFQCVGDKNTAFGDGGGGARFSPQGDKYAKFSPGDALFLFDFDRGTGELSNYEFIDIPQTGLAGGISFSPSGQFLYVSDRLYIRQYDVWSDDVAASEVIVAEYDGFIGNSLGQGTTFGQMQLAPDCRIYLNTGSAQEYMHVIMRPDEKGVGCDVRQHSIDIFFPNASSMPYFPNYRLGTDEPLCDSTKVIVLNGTMPPVATVDLQGEVKVFPNPASHFINVLLDKKGKYTMSIMDMAGLQVLAIETDQSEVTIDVRGLSAGIYVLQILDSNTGKRMVKKVMVK